MDKTKKREEMKNKIVAAIMEDKIGNLEWIVEHWVAEAPEDHIKEWSKELGIQYIKEE